ncbi:MAG: hypothetical protein AB1772_09905 [Candidatus Zixiibacteriota bacterium]
MIYYQGSQYGLAYDPRSNLNVTWIDSTAYRPTFLNQSAGRYSRYPQVVAQWDGANTIVHVLLWEDTVGTMLSGDYCCNNLPYYTVSYFRKVGDEATVGTWSAGRPIDSCWFPWASLAAAPYPQTGLAVTYTNPTFYGGLIDNPNDLDVWCRESFDRGVSWPTAYSVTNYMNAIAGHPNHFTAWLETQALYDISGDLHVVWTAKPTSSDPYFDGFDWTGFDQNIYHWAKSTNEIVKVATGSYEDFDDLCGGIVTNVYGFGGSNAGFIANISLSQCDDNLYCIWNQIHQRANRNDGRCYQPQPMPGVLDDCAYTDNPMARANWEIMMSVARMETPHLWDLARNVSNTYKPDCGLAGDPMADGLCGSEYKPTVERYGLDETGLDLTWPAATDVDLSPGHNYSGSFHLNMQYLDDQFPGPSMWGEWQTQPKTLNWTRWIRLACVEPVEAAWIVVRPPSISWPK